MSYNPRICKRPDAYCLTHDCYTSSDGLGCHDAPDWPRPYDAPEAPPATPEALWEYPAPVLLELLGESQARPPMAGDWLNSLSSPERKEVAMSRGFMAYFPDAAALVARHSVRMNEKHNPGEAVHWARGKSGDQADCEARHLAATAANPESTDSDGAYHMVSKAWRAMAELQLWAEKLYARDGRIA